MFVYELSGCGFEYHCCPILCLNTFAKLQSAGGASRRSVLMGNYPIYLLHFDPTSLLNGFYKSIPGAVQSIRFRGHEKGVS